MNDFVRCNKQMGVHWLKGPMDDLKIKIKLKLPEDVISLPKFEDYINNTNDAILEKNIEEFTFKWQEKLFSESEIHRYRDVHNCLTENELEYHELLKNKEINHSKVFSYIHEDCYMPLPQEKNYNVNLLSSFLERLGLDGAVGRIGEAIGGKSASERHLFKSQDDVREENEQWTSMHVVFDYSDYNEGTLLLKQEAILLSIYHNTSHNYIILKPDVNKIDTNPYMVENSSGELLGHQYEVEVDFGQQGGGEELELLLSKLHKKWCKKHKQLVNFVMPPLGITHYHLSFELISAKNFERDNLYIKYDIKMSESVQCSDVLHGRTHVAESILVDSTYVYHFGQLIELSLEMNSGIEPPPLVIYFEAISTDFWHRHRTEGYTHLQIPLNPGTSCQELRCIRPDEDGAHERRFFLGGCHLIKDLEVLSRPELQNGDYTFTETGSISIRTSVMRQRSVGGASAGAAAAQAQHAAGAASALLVGADAALTRYRKARARLAHATTTADYTTLTAL